MSSVRRFVRRLGQFIGAGRGERDLAKEVDAHLSLLEQEYSRRGLPPDEARRAARRAFGNVESAKEQQRDARSFTWMEDLRRDIAYGSRALARTPGFTAVAVITLALGIGAVTVTYSVLRNVVLDPFPYSRSDRMVNVLLKDESDRIIRGPYFPAAEFLDYEEQAVAFEDVVGTSRQAMHWTSESGAERMMIAWMTPNGFTFLGVGPQLGRVFGAADAAPGAPPVGVLNHRTWVRLFGIFASTGVVLVAFGVYGVLAYTVSQQTREIAIRMALGGVRRHVLRMVVRLGLRLIGAGLAIGAVTSLLTNRLLVNQLWNTSPHDPMTFMAALTIILVIGAFACWVPARRAVRVEPMVALRHE
jgi:hypothetical protein